MPMPGACATIAQLRSSYNSDVHKSQIRLFTNDRRSARALLRPATISPAERADQAETDRAHRGRLGDRLQIATVIDSAVHGYRTVHRCDLEAIHRHRGSA